MQLLLLQSYTKHKHRYIVIYDRLFSTEYVPTVIILRVFLLFGTVNVFQYVLNMFCTVFTVPYVHFSSIIISTYRIQSLDIESRVMMVLGSLFSHSLVTQNQLRKLIDNKIDFTNS